MDFEWDTAKNDLNLVNHGIDFEDAKEIFAHDTVESYSPRSEEDRWVATGLMEGRLITVVYTYREGRIRIISARRARKNEERAYHNHHPG